MRYLLCLLALAFTARAELKTDIEFSKPGDGVVTRDEFCGGAARFDAPDKNHDGKLPETEGCRP